PPSLASAASGRVARAARPLAPPAWGLIRAPLFASSAMCCAMSRCAPRSADRCTSLSQARCCLHSPDAGTRSPAWPSAQAAETATERQTWASLLKNMRKGAKDIPNIADNAEEALPPPKALPGGKGHGARWLRQLDPGQ